jgi:hypothetical protein
MLVSRLKERPQQTRRGERASVRERRRRAAVEVAGPVVRSEREQVEALRCGGRLAEYRSVA